MNQYMITVILIVFLHQIMHLVLSVHPSVKGQGQISVVQRSIFIG